MKIRKGFVSNSSSSSFVVIFPRIPKNADDVREIVFGNKESYYGPYDGGPYPTKQVSETIWRDICNQKPNNIKRAKEIVSSGHLDGCPDYDKYYKNGNYNWEEYHRDCDIFAEKKFNEFFNVRKIKLKKINGDKDILSHLGVLYCFKYGDEDGGYFSALEHGDLFKKLKHIKVSNH